MNGWYYGVWSGYYPWNKTNLNSDPVGGGDSKPPYSISVSANLKSDGTLQSDTAPAASWVGNVSSYSDVTIERGPFHHDNHAQLRGIFRR